MTSTMQTKRAGGAFVASLIALAFARWHVAMASAGEPFYAPPDIADAIFFVGIPCAFIALSIVASLVVLVMSIRASIHPAAMIVVIVLSLGCWMVTESMLEYTGDQRQAYDDEDDYRRANP